MGLSKIVFSYFLNDDAGLASSLVFIRVNGDSKIIAMYFADIALSEYLKNLFINGRSVYIFVLKTSIKFVQIVKPQACLITAKLPPLIYCEQPFFSTIEVCIYRMQLDDEAIMLVFITSKGWVTNEAIAPAESVVKNLVSVLCQLLSIMDQSCEIKYHLKR